MTALADERGTDAAARALATEAVWSGLGRNVATTTAPAGVGKERRRAGV